MRKSRRKQLRSRHKRIFAALLVVFAACLLLPRPATRWLTNLVQVFVPLQDAATQASDAVASSVAAVVAPKVPRAELDRAKGENEALHNTVAALRSRIVGLERDNGELAGIRRKGIPGRLIPASVVARDVLAWRESELLDAGTLRGIQPRGAVLSNQFAVNLGTEDGTTAGQAVLAAEAFVGTIDYAGTHTSRVRLVTDPATRMAVQVAPPDTGPLDAEFWLVGVGGDQARIQDVDHRYVRGDAGIQVGYRVLTSRDDVTLPGSMVIGRVSAIEQDAKSPLLYTLAVEPVIPAGRLRRVYVWDPTPPRRGG